MERNQENDTFAVLMYKLENGSSWADIFFCVQTSGDKRYWCSDGKDYNTNLCTSPLYAWHPPVGTSQAIVAQITGSSPTTSTSSSSSTSSTLSSPNTNNGDGNQSLAIGAGVGIPLGILALGLLTYLFFRKRRRRYDRVRGGNHGELDANGQPFRTDEHKSGYMHEAGHVQLITQLGGTPVAELAEHEGGVRGMVIREGGRWYEV
jgi:hypothetical protein